MRQQVTVLELPSEFEGVRCLKHIHALPWRGNLVRPAHTFVVVPMFQPSVRVLVVTLAWMACMRAKHRQHRRRVRSVCQYINERLKSGEKTAAQRSALHLSTTTLIIEKN